jgi:hypothetical protein
MLFKKFICIRYLLCILNFIFTITMWSRLKGLSMKVKQVYQHHKSSSEVDSISQIDRELALHSLIRINGPISFDGSGIHLGCGSAPPLCCLRSLDENRQLKYHSASTQQSLWVHNNVVGLVAIRETPLTVSTPPGRYRDMIDIAYS